MSAGFGPGLIVGFGVLTHPHRINNKTKQSGVRKNANFLIKQVFVYDGLRDLFHLQTLLQEDLLWNRYRPR